MAKNHVQPGNVIDVTLTATVASGDLMQVGTLVGVALKSGVSGETISVAIDEVYNVSKLAADNLTQGMTVYLDTANKRVTQTDASGANVRAGKVTKAAAAATTVVNIKLNA